MLEYAETPERSPAVTAIQTTATASAAGPSATSVQNPTPGGVNIKIEDTVGGKPSVELALKHWEATRPLQPHVAMHTFHTPVQTFGQAGLGTGQYFRWVRDYMVIFGFCWLLSLPLLIEVVLGNETGFVSPFASFTSIGNLNQQAVSVSYGVFDTLITLAVLLALWKVRSVLRQYEVDLDLAEVSTQDFAVKLSGLPPQPVPDLTQLTLELQTSVTAEFGPVVNTVVSVCNEEAILAARSLQKREIELVDAEQRVKLFDDPKYAREMLQAQTKLKAAKDRMYTESAVEAEYDTSGYAFVTFQSSADSTKCLTAGTHQFQGTTLTVSASFEPSDVVWENLGYSFSQRVVRTLLAFLLASGVIVVDTYFLVWINLLANPGGEPGQVSFAMVLLTTLGIIIGNVSMFILLPLLAQKFEKHHSYTHMEVSSMVKLVFFQTVNTFSIAYNVWGTPRNNPDFYNNGGNFVINLLIGDLLLLNGIELLRPEWLIQTKLVAPQAHSQTALNELYEGVPFMLWQRYQFVFKFICVTFTFGTALPICYFILFACLAMTYYVDRYNMLFKFKQPPKFNKTLAWFVMEVMMPVAIVLKVISSVYWFWITDSTLPLFFAFGAAGVSLLGVVAFWVAGTFRSATVVEHIEKTFTEYPGMKWFLDPLEDLNMDFKRDRSDAVLSHLLGRDRSKHTTNSVDAVDNKTNNNISTTTEPTEEGAREQSVETINLD